MKVFGVAGYSGAGKTTLLAALIPRFVARGLRVSLLKHTHHRFDIDRPGKDSFRLREAGCSEVMLISDQRWALMHELRDEPEPSFEEQVARFSACDLLLVEGFKHTPIPKLEVYRPSVGKPLLAGENTEGIVAVATDELAQVTQLLAQNASKSASSDAARQTTLPVLLLDEPALIADFILRYLEL